MADTPRSQSDLLTLFPDNTGGAISAQDLRDFLVSTLTGWYNVHSYGLKGDGTTDDTAALNALLAGLHTGSTAGTPGAVLFFPPGDYIISDTIDVIRQSVIFQGSGIGSSTHGWAAANGYTGHGTTLVWAGAAGSPMIQYVDCAFTDIRDMRLEGNNAAQPSAGVRYYNDGVTTGHGSNFRQNLTNVHIGKYPWAHNGNNDGGVDIGILIDGTNLNNAEQRFTNVKIEGQSTSDMTHGIKIENFQSLQVYLDHCQIVSAAIGLYSAVSMLAVNTYFAYCLNDIYQTSSGFATFVSCYSEGGSQLLKWDATDGNKRASLFYGGYVNTGLMTTNVIDCQQNAAGGGGKIVFNGTKWAQRTGEGTWKIRQLGAGGWGSGITLRFIDVDDMDDADFDVDPANAGAIHTVEYRNGHDSVEMLLENGDSFSLDGVYSALPTASEKWRGRHIVVDGGAGVQDPTYVCVKNSSDTYSWVVTT